MIRKTFFALALVAAALAVPLGAQARTQSGSEFQLVLKAPVTFEPVAGCATFGAVYGVALHGELGTGTNCILDQIPTACPTGVTADFCQDVPVAFTLAFAGGTMSGDLTIHEAYTCTATCTVQQHWVGTVDAGTRRFHKLEGASIDGGGILAFDATTGDLIALDETLAVTGV